MRMTIAKGLIELGCVKFSPHQPFTYASGLKGPLYCDNRLILSAVDFRKKIIEAFLDLIEKEKMEFDLLGGIATAGIPYASFISDRLGRPLIYIRSKAKEHGGKNQVEGGYLDRQSVLLVEDLVNQGASVLDAFEGLKKVGLVSSSCLSIVDYQMETASKRFKDLSLKLYSLTDFEHLICAGVDLQLINLEEKKLLLDWHHDPKVWSSLIL